jgi:hypothetical protein
MPAQTPLCWRSSFPRRIFPEPERPLVPGSLVIVTQLLLMVSLVLVIFAASASAEPLVYVVTASQQFGTVDLATGHFQGYRQWDARCPVQFSVVEGSDSAHAYNYSVDPETGAATPIGGDRDAA